jgi:hypothetical protein
MISQQDLFAAVAECDPLLKEEIDQLRYQLTLEGGWLSREHLCARLTWSERKLRRVAEALGAEIIRGQPGFKLTELITRDDLPAVQQAIDHFESQGKKMITVALGWRKKLHAIIG